MIERQTQNLLKIPMIDLFIEPTKKEITVDFREDCEFFSSSDTDAKKIIVPPTVALPKHRKLRQGRYSRLMIQLSLLRRC